MRARNASARSLMEEENGEVRVLRCRRPECEDDAINHIIQTGYHFSVFQLRTAKTFCITSLNARCMSKSKTSDCEIIKGSSLTPYKSLGFCFLLPNSYPSHRHHPLSRSNTLLFQNTPPSPPNGLVVNIVRLILHN